VLRGGLGERKDTVGLNTTFFFGTAALEQPSVSHGLGQTQKNDKAVNTLFQSDLPFEWREGGSTKKNPPPFDGNKPLPCISAKAAQGRVITNQTLSSPLKDGSPEGLVAV
jgi:hypothetical protein